MLDEKHGFLKRRFQEYDSKKNRHLLPIAITFFFILFLPAYFLVGAGIHPVFSGLVLLTSFVLAMASCWFWIHVVIERQATKYGLRYRGVIALLIQCRVGGIRGVLIGVLMVKFRRVALIVM